MKKNFTVIAAGGLGTRLKDYEQNKHTKVLIPIGNYSMISRQIIQLKSWNLKNFVVITNPEFHELIKNDLKQNFPTEKFEYVIQEEQLGIAHALKQAEPYVDEGSKVSFVLGDNFIGSNPFLDSDSDNPNSHAFLTLKEVSNPQDFGIAEIKRKKIINLIEKPKKYISNLAILGFYQYDYSCFALIDSLNKSDRGEFEITALNQRYLEMGLIKYNINNSWWIDAGTPERIKELENKLI
tara:strand:- start:559 stop:1272 length:714 start_codon:yes stop_codon:yes gene_type:complete